MCLWVSSQSIYGASLQSRSAVSECCLDDQINKAVELAKTKERSAVRASPSRLPCLVGPIVSVRVRRHLHFASPPVPLTSSVCPLLTSSITPAHSSCLPNPSRPPPRPLRPLPCPAPPKRGPCSTTRSSARSCAKCYSVNAFSIRTLYASPELDF